MKYILILSLFLFSISCSNSSKLQSFHYKDHVLLEYNSFYFGCTGILEDIEERSDKTLYMIELDSTNLRCPYNVYIFETQENLHKL